MHHNWAYFVLFSMPRAQNDSRRAKHAAQMLNSTTHRSSSSQVLACNLLEAHSWPPNNIQ